MEQGTRQRYRPLSEPMCFILDTFLNKMYLDRKKDDRYNLFRLKVDFPDTKEGREKREEYEERTRLPHYWVNSPAELFRQYQKMCEDNKSLKQVSESTFYRCFKTLEREGILIPIGKTGNNMGKRIYYLEESSKGYQRLLKFVHPHYQRFTLPDDHFHLDPAYSRYSLIVLNRQFILDCLRNITGSICMIVNGELVELPIIGNYLKNYEVKGKIEEFKGKLLDVRSVLDDRTQNDYRMIQEILLGVDDEMAQDEYHSLTDEKRESNRRLIDIIICGLDKELDYLKQYSETFSIDYKQKEVRAFSDRASKGYAEHISKLSPDHKWYIDPTMEVMGLSFYRSEAVWESIYLTDSEKKQLDSVFPGLSDDYPDIIEEKIVMPLLCLAQMSPSVLFALASLDSGGSQKEPLTYSEEIQHLFPQFISETDIPPELMIFRTSSKTYNMLLGKLTKVALADYLNHRYRISPDWAMHPTFGRTCLLTFGSSMIRHSDGKQYFIPALFTFGIYKDYTLSIHYNESPSYNLMDEFLSPSADHPRSTIFDWSPAVSSVNRGICSPNARLYDLFMMMVSSVGVSDFCLHSMIEQCILRGDV